MMDVKKYGVDEVRDALHRKREKVLCVLFIKNAFEWCFMTCLFITSSRVNHKDLPTIVIDDDLD